MNGADEGITVGMQGAAALVTLDRPRALNALNCAMRAKLAAAVPRFARDAQVYCVVIRSTSAKAFCAGGDVRESIAAWRADPVAARAAFAAEYQLNWQLECFSKPTISLIEGMVMGSGVGLSLFGTHRVAGEGYRFAMPETLIGLFPDVGVAHTLARLPDEVGLYLGLTGRTIGRAEAYALGLATHCIPAAAFGDIVERLADAQPVDPELDGRHADPGPGELADKRATIARCFSATTVEDIIARLGAETGANREWAAAVAADLAQRSPLSLKLTLRHIREARATDLRETLRRDYRLACRSLADHDFAEGVRALLVDKDNKPVWKPGRLADVTEDMVERYFAPLTGDLAEMELPTREQMQEMRA